MLDCLFDLYQSPTTDMVRAVPCILNMLHHPSIDLNGTVPCGLKLLVALSSYNAPEWGQILEDVFLDEDVILSFRDEAGNSIYHDSTTRYTPEAQEIIKRAETNRLEWAKERVRILKNWNAGIPSRKEDDVLDENVLSEYVLPYVADIVRPIEEIGDSKL